ncbi:MAG: tetratricopeptide repeat protein [Planctomycetia bacterium]|nr:tetratricopeptide repeat protein [Planctomycetia bacterium]
MNQCLSRLIRWPGAVATCVLLLVLLAPTMAHAQSLGRGQLTAEETRFVNELLLTYDSPDLLRTWVASRIKTVDSSGRASLEFSLADAMRLDGDVDGYESEIQKLAKKYPNHPRAKGAQLESVLASLLRLDDANTEAVFSTNPAQRQKAIENRDRIWALDVETVLVENIRRLNEEVDAAEKSVMTNTDDGQKDTLAEKLGSSTRMRDLWEFNRLNAFKVYAGMLPDGTEDSTQKYLELASFAEEFVNSRYENFGRRYEAQLIFGQALSSAGKAQEAASELELLVDIEPSADPPFSDDVIYFIRKMRIEALTGSLQAYNRAGMPEDGLDLLDFLYDAEASSFPYRTKPENPDLLTLSALLDVEEGVTRIASGDRDTGMKLIKDIITKFDVQEAYDADPAQAREIVNGANRGLSMLVELGAGNLPAEFYTRAALGFRDRGLPSEAIEIAKLALYATDFDKETQNWRAEALYEIGESSDALGRTIEAAVSYQVLAENYPDTRSVSMAAQNFFAITGDLAKGEGGAWDELLPVAEKLFADNSKGLGSEQLKLQQAVEAELEGDYRKARDLFRRVSKLYKLDGVENKVPFFYRARAGAARCLFRSSSDSEQAIKDASGEILPLLEQARSDRDEGGESVLRYELAKMHWSDKGKDAEKALSILDPIMDALSGNSVYREGALLFLLEILSANAKQERSERVLAELKKNWRDNPSLVAGTYYLIEAYSSSSKKEDLQRAGELVLAWIALPGANYEEAGPGVRLGLASILIDGGFAAEAAEMLAVAAEAASQTEEESLVIGVSYFRAKAANAAGKHRDALESLNTIIDRYGDETVNGSYNEAPFVFVQRAFAEMGLYKKDNSVQRLDSMSKDLKNALAILDQRRRSLVFAGGTTAVFERDYWSVWLQYMEVLKALNKCEDVVQLIRSRRLMVGDNTSSFAPEDLQARFDKLESECK